MTRRSLLRAAAAGLAGGGVVGAVTRAALAEDLSESGGTIHLDVAGRPAAVSDRQIREWVRVAALAVSRYYGRFPVKAVDLHVTGEADEGEIHGRTFDGRRIEMELGPRVAPTDLSDDWVLTHEMFHLAFPDLDESHLWMNEGLSTYLEPIARVRIGTLRPERIWKDMAESMPNGLPGRGDRGLDHTHTWGRTYWGGCLFWLVADVRIRQQTKNRRGLDDATRAVLEAGGDGSQYWSMKRVLDVADRATGTGVLHALYAQLAQNPGSIDLAKLWSDLGVRLEGGKLTLDDAAPLAEVRKAIAAPPAEVSTQK